MFSLAPNVEYIKRGKMDIGKKGKFLKLTSRAKYLALQLFENHLALGAKVNDAVMQINFVGHPFYNVA